MSENVKPSPHIEGKFKVVGIVPGEIVHPKLGQHDLRSISLAYAKKLFEAGCPYLEEVKPEIKPEVKTETKTR